MRHALRSGPWTRSQLCAATSTAASQAGELALARHAAADRERRLHGGVADRRGAAAGSAAERASGREAGRAAGTEAPRRTHSLHRAGHGANRDERVGQRRRRGALRGGAPRGRGSLACGGQARVVAASSGRRHVQRLGVGEQSLLDLGERDGHRVELVAAQVREGARIFADAIEQRAGQRREAGPLLGGELLVRERLGRGGGEALDVRDNAAELPPGVISAKSSPAPMTADVASIARRGIVQPSQDGRRQRAKRPVRCRPLGRGAVPSAGPTRARTARASSGAACSQLSSRRSPAAAS